MMVRRGTLIVALLIVLVTSGCAALSPRQERTRFLLLVAASSGTAEGANSNPGSLTIGLGPIQLPEYLDRQELVVRTSPNGFNLSDTDRWAEPLADNFRHVLATDLRTQLGTGNILQYPWYPGTKLDYVVRLQVERFDADINNTAELIARWELRIPKNDQLLASRESQFSHPANSGTGDAIAAALSADVAALGQQIGSAIVQAQQERFARGES
jgi:uncharacterized lipoprotein YmbA